MAYTITTEGDAQIDTAQSKFGGASGLFDGTGDYITAPDSDDWYFGTDKFTIDFWMRTSNTTDWMAPLGQSSSDSNGWGFGMNGGVSGGRLDFGFNNAGTWSVNFNVTGVVGIMNGSWHHIEVARDGSTWYLFIDGTAQSKNLALGSYAGGGDNIAGPLYIGKNGSDYNFMAGPFDGHLDEVRVSKGIVRHTSNFSVPTSAYSNDGDTQLLLHMDGTDGSTTFIDSSSDIRPDAISRNVTGTNTTATQAHTCTGDNRILFTSVLTFKSGDDTDRLTSITYNGVAMTQIGSTMNHTSGVNIYLFYLIAPSTGANNIVCTCDATMDEIDLRSASYTGAKQSGVPDASVSNGPTASQTSFSQSVTMTEDNCWLVGSWRNNAGAWTVGTNTYGRVDNSGADSMVLIDSNSSQGTAGSKTMTATCSSATVGGIMASFAPVTAVSGPANLSTWNGVAKASIDTINGVAIASVKTINGVA